MSDQHLANEEMAPDTLEALRGSIAKWEAIVAGTGIDALGDNCDLCIAFENCVGCPVATKTGRGSCYGTPYYEWRRATVGQGDYRRRAETAEQITAAQAELDFLKSLLPRDKAALDQLKEKNHGMG